MNLRVPHPPGFPVEVGGVGVLHAAFLIESRIEFVKATKSDRKSRILQRVGYANVCIEILGSMHAPFD